MDDLAAFFPLIAIILGVVLVIGFIWLATKAMWKVAEPNEALIISGLTRGTLENTDGMDFKIVTGKGALVVPGLQTVRSLALTLNETELKVSCVTSQGIQVIVDGVVIYKIGDAPPLHRQRGPAVPGSAAQDGEPGLQRVRGAPALDHRQHDRGGNHPRAR